MQPMDMAVQMWMRGRGRDGMPWSRCCGSVKTFVYGRVTLEASSIRSSSVARGNIGSGGATSLIMYIWSVSWGFPHPALPSPATWPNRHARPSPGHTTQVNRHVAAYSRSRPGVDLLGRVLGLGSSGSMIAIQSPLFRHVFDGPLGPYTYTQRSDSKSCTHGLRLCCADPPPIRRPTRHSNRAGLIHIATSAIPALKHAHPRPGGRPWGPFFGWNGQTGRQAIGLRWLSCSLVLQPFFSISTMVFPRWIFSTDIFRVTKKFSLWRLIPDFFESSLRSTVQSSMPLEKERSVSMLYQPVSYIESSTAFLGQVHLE